MTDASAYYGLTPTDDILTVPSVNGSPTLQVRITDAGPERRIIAENGQEFRDGSSAWQIYTVEEMHRQTALRTPIAEFLQRHIDWSVTTFAGAREVSEYRTRRR